MNNEYKAGQQGGRCVIDFPAENKGKRYKRSVWKDGTIVYKEVTA